LLVLITQNGTYTNDQPFDAGIKFPGYFAKDPGFKWLPITLHVTG
jgi:hypothetical protein